MNHRAAARGVPLVRPMYHLAPDEPEAYAVPLTFAFGSELVVAAITSPRDPVTLLGSVRAWLPEGPWIDLATAEVLPGGGTVDLHRDGSSVPALLKAGGIVPLAAEHETDAAANPRALEVVVAPGADGRLDLVEDDGTGTALPDIRSVRTPLAWDQESGTLTIGPADGPGGIVPRTRTWTVTVLGVEAPRATTDGVDVEAAAADGRTSVTATADTTAALRISVGPHPRPRTSDVPGRLFRLLDAAQHPYEEKAAILRTLRSGRPVVEQLAELQARDLPPALLSALTELLTAA
jgi:hypothetical protein